MMMMIKGGVYDNDDDDDKRGGVYNNDDDDKDNDIGGPGFYSKRITDEGTRRRRGERLEMRDATDHWRKDRSTELGSKPE